MGVRTISQKPPVPARQASMLVKIANEQPLSLQMFAVDSDLLIVQHISGLTVLVCIWLFDHVCFNVLYFFSVDFR